MMALLGHVSAEMGLRYGRLFDATVYTEYERALTIAKTHPGPVPQDRATLPLTDVSGGSVGVGMAGGSTARSYDIHS